MFKNEVIDDIWTVSCRILKKMLSTLWWVGLSWGQVGLISYKMRFLNLLDFEIESESRFNSDENCFLVYTFTKNIQPACPQKRSTRHNDLCWDLLESTCMHTCALFLDSAYYRASINNFSFTHFICKKFTLKIREIWGCILEALMKNLHLYIPQFFGFDETLIAFILASKSKIDLDSLNDWLSDKNFVSEISSWF